jgi:AbrB family looped-hinge helix DNA binding protein
MSVATLTSKGQITLPKSIRTKLHLETGVKIAFQYDETKKRGEFYPVNKRAEDVFGMLRRPHSKKPATVEEMNIALRNKFKREFK